MSRGEVVLSVGETSVEPEAGRAREAGRVSTATSVVVGLRALAVAYVGSGREARSPLLVLRLQTVMPADDSCATKEHILEADGKRGAWKREEELVAAPLLGWHSALPRGAVPAARKPDVHAHAARQRDVPVGQVGGVVEPRRIGEPAAPEERRSLLRPRSALTRGEDSAVLLGPSTRQRRVAARARGERERVAVLAQHARAAEKREQADPAGRSGHLLRMIVRVEHGHQVGQPRQPALLNLALQHAQLEEHRKRPRGPVLPRPSSVGGVDQYGRA
eukprot:scaffold38652_cov23-Tisochrysis_lutea.AAC.2